MLSNLGNILLFINIFLSVLIIYFASQNIKTSGNSISETIYQTTLLQTTLIFGCFFTLVAAFITSDFSLINVFENSHTSKPLLYKISGSWGNHEGSLMLWVIILTIFSFFFLINNKTHPKNYRLFTLIFQNIIILGFLSFILFNSNPFALISPAPKEGLGLNPILQDPALAIHPPLLYIGFVGSSIYFSAAMASLMTNYSEKFFAKSIKNWVLISWVFQTLGILVGSIWAYYELGWGGFWFWDPVENASLLPWFAMTALFHSLIVLEKRNVLYFWVIILCLLTFVLSVTGTFLVRSGILNSVHTFANDPNRGIYMLSFLCLMIFSSLFLLFKKYRKNNYNINFNSKETYVLINNWFMLFYLLTVLIGTLYPIFTDALTENKISVGPPFYNAVIIPVVVIFLFFMAIGPNVKWIKNKFDNLISLIIIFILALIINFIIVYFFKSFTILSNLIIISSLFLIISSLIDLKKSLEKSKFDLARIISHLSFGFLILFIGLNHNFSLEEDFNMKVGDTKSFNNYEIKFKKLEVKNFKNYKSLIGDLEIKDKKMSQIKTLNPEIRIYESPSTLTYEAAIKTNIIKDYYLTMSNIDRSDFYNIKFQKKPMMFWIWVSCVALAIGGFLRVFQNAKSN